MINSPQPALDDLLWLVSQSKTPRLRSMLDFAESEIVIPDGPYAGRRFRTSRQPYTRLWLEAVDSGRWPRHVASGPTQSGKTLCCFVVPLLYHLFEIGETVICGLPDMDMAADKWREDILPVLERSRYRDLLPTQGSGSRGGKVESIRFLNGATLKFMSGGGGDKSRAGFTSRVVVVTETDGLDQASAASRESDKITQLEARTRAYGLRKRVYLECTVSTEEGRTWKEYQNSTKSRIVLPCPYCRAWVSPEREHLTGWQGAESETEACRTGHFSCPACGEVWSGQDRIQANAACRLLHEGQDMDEEGNAQGDPPPTQTFGLRWSAVNNLFLSPGEIAADEWRAARDTNEENAEREMRQFVWCLPAIPLKVDALSLDAAAIVARTVEWPRGIVPPNCQYFTAALDLGKYLAHWLLIAWLPEARGHIVDYARLEIPSQDLGVEQATMVALRQFREMVLSGWPKAEADGQTLVPLQVWIDAGYMTDVVYAFCRESGDRFRPSVGRGATQQKRQWYNRPTHTGSTVKHIGQGFHINYLPAEKLYLNEVDADYWKTWAQQRLNTPIDAPGSMSLFQTLLNEHLSLAKHFTAETKVEEFIPGKGMVTRWERIRRQNHWFDCLYNACAAANFCGVRLVDEEPPPRPKPRQTNDQSVRRPDGRPWIDLDRWQEMMERWR